MGKHVCWQAGSEGHVGALQVSAEQQHICSTYTYIYIYIYREGEYSTGGREQLGSAESLPGS